MNTGLITRYTGALYTAPEHCCPRYDEFRDMFSEGQLKSKLWLIQELGKHTEYSNKSIAIAGSWFATLAFLLLEDPKNINLKISCIDIDSRCNEFVRFLLKDNELDVINRVTADMFDYSYSENVIINTSCEHLKDISKWLALVPSHSLVALQTNNFFSHPTHVSCANSLAEFQSTLSPHISETLFSGELDLGVYTRYMVIGRKR